MPISVESGASVVYVKVGRNDRVEHRNIVCGTRILKYQNVSILNIRPFIGVFD
jgi:hypothetical protein